MKKENHLCIYASQNFQYNKLRYTKQKMFGGIDYQQPISSGKKIAGFQPSRHPALSLGWDQSEQLNSYQLRKKQGKEITGKITGYQAQSSHHELPQRQQPIYNEAEERMKMKQLYERLAYQNPDIPPEALEKYMVDYQQQRRTSLHQQQQQQRGPTQSQQYQRRQPIKQKQSMRDIIYNGVGVGESMQEKRAASRRNNSNLVLGDGYNYFQENQRR